MGKSEFGNVRSFKKVIIIIAAVIVGLAAGLAISFIRCRDLSLELAELEEQLENVPADAGQGENISVSDSAPDKELAYQSLFPDMYVEEAAEFAHIYNEDRYFYFTFDGGPSDSTEVILDTLSELGIKATFFVSGGENTDGSEEIIKRI